MLKPQTKKNLICNSAVELGANISDEAKGKGRAFISRFIEAGLVHYAEFGDVLITKETLDKFIYTMVGCPVIIMHKDIDDSNADKERVGVVSKVWYEPMDGWFYCEGIIWDKQAIDLIKNQQWNVSCTYDFESDFQKGSYHGKKYDMEFTGGEFLHLALVSNPRYERANIVMNAKDDNEEFITVGEGEEAHPIPLDFLKQDTHSFSIKVKGLKKRQKYNAIIIAKNVAAVNKRVPVFSDEHLLLKASTKEALTEKVVNIAQEVHKRLGVNIPEDSKTGELLKNINKAAQHFIIAEMDKDPRPNNLVRLTRNVVSKALKRDCEVFENGSYGVRFELKHNEGKHTAKWIDVILAKLKIPAATDGISETDEAKWLKIKFERKDSEQMVTNTEEKGKWVTIKGTHVFIPEGKSVEEAVKEKFKEKDTKKDSLKGKYAKEDVEFDEEQAKKDIAIAKEKGYRTIEEIAEYLGLDEDEVRVFEDDKPSEKPKFDDKGFEEFMKKERANNNIEEMKGNVTMTVLSELEAFIKGIVANAADEQEKEDKFEEQKEVAENEEDKEEVENKCDKPMNEDKKEETKEDEEEDKEKSEEDQKQEVKNEADDQQTDESANNSMDDIKKAVFGGNTEVQNTTYIPHSKRIELGNNY